MQGMDVDLHYNGRIQFRIEESHLAAEVTHLTRTSYSNLAQHSHQSASARSQRASLLGILLRVLEFFFGCHHVHLSRVFTMRGETYKVCCDCGARFTYSLKTMSIERRLPLSPVLTRFRIA